VIRVLFREYAVGAHSFFSLARWMNEQGYPTVRSIDAPKSWAINAQWDADKVKGILSNERYAGRLPRNDGKVFDATAHPPLIDKERPGMHVSARGSHAPSGGRPIVRVGSTR